MENIRIKCPICGVILETLDNPANYEKSIVCPNCKTKKPFREFKRIVPKAPIAPEEDATQIGTFKRDFIGYLLDQKTHRQYQLKEGKNLIGRMTLKNTPKADVPIITDDSGMSREHLYLEVINGADGHYHTYAYNAKNKNDTLINGHILKDGDKIGIKHGDVLTLCETNLRYFGNIIQDETEI